MSYATAISTIIGTPWLIESKEEALRIPHVRSRLRDGGVAGRRVGMKWGLMSWAPLGWRETVDQG